MMDLKARAATDVGQRRDHNEDRYFCDVELGIFAVADGIGGKPGGEVASQAIIDGLEMRAADIRRFIDARSERFDESKRDEISDYLFEELQAINEDVYYRGMLGEFPQGIGSTLDLVVLTAGGAFVLHVGDSRVYLLRGDEVFRITRDHTFERRLLENPELRGGHGAPSKYSHVLTRSVGRAPRVKVDRLFVGLQTGDRLVLCTDGISDYFGGQEILGFAQIDDGDLSQRLVNGANEAGGKDNATAVVVSITEDVESAFLRQPTRPDTFKRVRFLKSLNIFSELDLQELLKLLRYINIRECNSDEPVISRGDEVDGLYMVMSGSLAVEIHGVHLDSLAPGDHFGEIGLFGDPVRSADVHCIESCEVLFLSKEHLQRLLREDPVLGNKLLLKLLARCSEIVQQLLAEQS